MHLIPLCEGVGEGLSQSCKRSLMARPRLGTCWYDVRQGWMRHWQATCAKPVMHSRVANYLTKERQTLATPREVLAQTLRKLWSQSGLPEEIFAREFLGISRSHFANLINRRYLPGREVIDRCCEKFPDEADRLRNLFEEARHERQSEGVLTPALVWRTERDDSTPHVCTWSSEKLRYSFDLALSRMSTGEHERAAQGLRLALRDAEKEHNPCLTCVRRAWRQLGELSYGQGDLRAAESSYMQAIKVAVDDGDEAAATHYTDRLAALFMYSDDFSHAIEVISVRLSRRPQDGRLWRRYGVIRWYEGLLLDAYASLSLALNLGVPTPRIYHARGQVLAELGLFAEAVVELSQVIETPLAQDSLAYAISSRAYAFAGLGDFDRAMREFSMAENITPDNAWLHYFRAISYDKKGKRNEAVSGYQQALRLKLPALNKPKREYAQRRLNELGYS